MHNSCLTNNVALLLKRSLKCINFTTLYDLMVCESRTSHQRETKPWPPRHYKPQRIRQEWGDRTPIWHQPPVFLFFPLPPFSSEVHFLTPAHKTVHTQFAASCCTVPHLQHARAHGKKNTAPFPQMPDSYTFWHACKKVGKCPLSSALVFRGQHLYKPF